MLQRQVLINIAHIPGNRICLKLKRERECVWGCGEVDMEKVKLWVEDFLAFYQENERTEAVTYEKASE